MADQFYITLPVTIRICRESDLSNLEWFGSMTEYRQTISYAFERLQKGEIIMLVAEANRFPIGQVWIDLTKQRENANDDRSDASPPTPRMSLLRDLDTNLKRLPPKPA